MLGIVAGLAVLPFVTDAAGASPPASTTTTTVPSGTVPSTGAVTGLPYARYWFGIPPQAEPYNRPNSGMPNATIKIFNKLGQLAIYGNSSVLYVLPQLLQHTYSTAALFKLGEQLYASNCSACHGVRADGVPPDNTPVQGGGFPSLQHVSPAAIDFWIESGRMPAVATNLTQPIRRPARLDQLQALAIATYLNTLFPATPTSRRSTSKARASRRARSCSPRTAPRATRSPATATPSRTTRSRRRCATSPPRRSPRRSARARPTCPSSRAT